MDKDAYGDFRLTYIFVFARRTTCLKYLVLANMLMKSGINPFDSQEAKPYKNDPEILAMTNLVRLVDDIDLGYKYIFLSNLLPANI